MSNTVFSEKGNLYIVKNGQRVNFTSLDAANKHLAKCCGIRCCAGDTALVLVDNTTNVKTEFYVDSGVFYGVIDGGIAESIHDLNP